MSQTYYDILGVTQTASFEEIKHAFRTKAKEYHPDYHPDDKDAERKFKEINEAYEVLKDAQKRATYDRVGHAAYTNGATGGFSPGFGGFGFSKSGFENIFDDVFNAFNGQRPHPSAINRGEDIRYNLAIDLGDAYFGAKKNITIDTFVKCPKCDGRGGKNLSTCPTCGGMGHVRQRQGFFIMETECPVCHGTGKTVKDPCSDCKGAGRLRRKRTLEVSIPAGVDTGVRMRLTGEESAETKSRVSSFYRTCKELGIEVPPEYVREAAYRDTTKTYLETEALLKCRICPTCILFPDDFAYIGGFNAITLAGKRVPEDISTIGYDGIEIGKYLEPALATLKQDSELLGRRLAEKLIEEIEQPKICLVEHLLVEGKIYPGRSVKKLTEAG